MPSKAESFQAPPPKVYSTEDLKSLIVASFPNDPIMLRIAHCESGTRQFYASSTKVVTSHTHDYGVMQINRGWIPKAKELGFDIMKPEDNIKMAKVIKDVQGLRAWTCYKLLAKS